MKKLTTVFAIVAMTTSLGLAGCKGKKAEESTSPPPAAAKTTDDKAAPAPTPAGGSPTTPTPTPATGTATVPATGAAPTAATGDLPQECQDYKAAMEKLASCDKLPQASKDALKQSYDTMSGSWANVGSMPADAKAAMATGCKSGADALKQTGSAVCGW